MLSTPLRRGYTIAFAVCLVHFTFMALLYQEPEIKPTLPTKPLFIQTVTLKEIEKPPSKLSVTPPSPSPPVTEPTPTIEPQPIPAQEVPTELMEPSKPAPIQQEEVEPQSPLPLPEEPSLNKDKIQPAETPPAKKEPSPAPKPKKKSKPAVPSEKGPVKKANEKPSTKPLQKKVQKEPSSSKKMSPPPKAPPPSKEEVAQRKKQESLLKEAKESLSKLNSSQTDSSLFALSSEIPKPLESLQIEIPKLDLSSGGTASKEHLDYLHSLIPYLKAALTLPEHGDVKIKLTLTRDGQVKSHQILQTESKKNQSYLEKRLPSLHCPHFGIHFSDEKTHTFTLTLTSSAT